MTQASVDFQKLLDLEQERHLQEEDLEELETVKTIPFPLEKTMKELNQDIFLDNKAIKNYSSTKIKARNFLTNVSYNRITTADYKNNNFVIDCFTFLILYLNPFYLERKFETNVEREFVNTLWMFLMPSNLYNYITQNENMKTLNKIKIKYQDAKEIVIGFIKHDQSNLSVLSEFLEKSAILYQFLYGNLFPKCFCRINDYGIRAKTLFSTYYHNLNIQKNIINWQNNNLKIKEEEKEEEEEPQKYDNASPINMTTLNDNDDDNNNKNIKEKQNDKEKKKKTKRKIDNNESKEKKRELKKQRLLEQLNENTEKLKKLKKKKIN